MVPGASLAVLGSEFVRLGKSPGSSCSLPRQQPGCRAPNSELIREGLAWELAASEEDSGVCVGVSSA